VTVRGSCRVIRRVYSGLAGGKIMTVHGYCDGREDQYGSFSGLVLF
jgi:hypothetical protein